MRASLLSFFRCICRARALSTFPGQRCSIVSSVQNLLMVSVSRSKLNTILLLLNPTALHRSSHCACFRSLVLHVCAFFQLQHLHPQQRAVEASLEDLSKRGLWRKRICESFVRSSSRVGDVLGRLRAPLPRCRFGIAKCDNRWPSPPACQSVVGLWNFSLLFLSLSSPASRNCISNSASAMRESENSGQPCCCPVSRPPRLERNAPSDASWHVPSLISSVRLPDGFVALLTTCIQPCKQLSQLQVTVLCLPFWSETSNSWIHVLMLPN